MTIKVNKMSVMHNDSITVLGDAVIDVEETMMPFRFTITTGGDAPGARAEVKDGIYQVEIAGLAPGQDLVFSSMQYLGGQNWRIIVSVKRFESTGAPYYRLEWTIHA